MTTSSTRSSEHREARKGRKRRYQSKRSKLMHRAWESYTPEVRERKLTLLAEARARLAESRAARKKEKEVARAETAVSPLPAADPSRVGIETPPSGPDATPPAPRISDALARRLVQSLAAAWTDAPSRDVVDAAGAGGATGTGGATGAAGATGTDGTTAPADERSRDPFYRGSLREDGTPTSEAEASSVARSESWRINWRPTRPDDGAERPHAMIDVVLERLDAVTRELAELARRQATTSQEVTTFHQEWARHQDRVDRDREVVEQEWREVVERHGRDVQVSLEDFRRSVVRVLRDVLPILRDNPPSTRPESSRTWVGRVCEALWPGL